MSLVKKIKEKRILQISLVFTILCIVVLSAGPYHIQAQGIILGQPDGGQQPNLPYADPLIWDSGLSSFSPQTNSIAAQTFTATNLLLNGDFESGAGTPSSWTSDAWTPSFSTFLWDSTQAHSGARSVKITNTTSNDARWLQTVAVNPNTDYRLSGWIKTSNVSHSVESVDAGANLCLYGTYTYSTPLFGTNNWTQVSLSFNSGSNTQVTIGARLGYWSGTATGTAWFDDLALELVSTPTTYIQNPGFENGIDNQPDIWWNETIQGSASFEWDNTTMHSGGRSAKIVASGQSIARWYQSVLVDQDSEYELAGWIKTFNVIDPSGQWWTTGAKLGIYGLNSWMAAATPGIRETHDWTYVSVRFITGSTTLAKVTCTLGEADPLYSRPTSSGTMWCDDLTLTKIRTLSRTHLTGTHVALDLYTEDYAYFNDPVTYVAHLDKVYDLMHEMVNGVPFNGDVITIREDASIYYGLLSGNPVTIGPGHSWMDIVNANGIDWGVPHELGHDFDLSPQYAYYMGQMAFDGAEQWANLKILYAYDTLGVEYPGLTQNMWCGTASITQVGQCFIDTQATPWINSHRTDYQNMHNDVYTGLLYSLKKQVGWEPFKKLIREYQQTGRAIPSTDLGKVELWANLLGRYAGVNFIPAYQSWGFPILGYSWIYLPLLMR
jgi:hypothetical protein